MSENRSRIIKELMYIGILPLLFYISAYYYLQPKQLPRIMIIVYLLAMLWVVFFCLYIVKKIKSKRVFQPKVWVAFLDKHYLKVLLFCILTVFNVQSIVTLPRWDGLLYYTFLIKQCNVFDFTLSGLIDGFRIVHPSHGYYCFLAIGAYLFENQLMGVLVMQLILYLITMFCYFGLLRMLFPRAKENFCFWGTLFFAFSPLIFGIEPIISCDYGVFCYLIIFLFVSLKRYPLLEIWVAILLILSKQQGVLYYVAFYGIVFLVNILRFYRTNHKIDVGEIRKLLRRMIPGFVGIGYYMVSSASPFAWMKGMQNSTNNIADLNESVQTLQGIGVNGEYIIEKLKQIFILNFAWVNWLIILVGAVSIVYMRIKHGNRVKISASIYGLIGIAVVYIAFNLFVVTYTNPRYLSVGTVVTSIGAFGILNLYFNFQKEKLKRIILYGLTGISLIASFVSIDPISFLVFRSFPVGKLYMYQPLYDNPNMYPSDIYADNTVYNRQFAFYTFLEEKMLREIQYDGSIPILQIDMAKELPYEQGTYDYINMMLEGLYGRMRLYWDEENGKLTGNDNDIPMKVYYFWSEQIKKGVNNKGDTLPDSAYAVLLPRQDKGILNTLQKKYKILRKYDISAYGMSLSVYKIQLK
ncbi:MAG: hypothetical protein HFH73_01165 [Lachnospiraceae bacterium]|nr:hypothetical protein [Lachnospiraceae bacterium]